MKLLFALLFVSFQVNTYATTEDSKAWLGVFTKKNLDPGYSVWQEVQLRYGSDVGSMQQTLVRFGLLQKFSDYHELGVIMGYIQTGLTKEYRSTLQHFYTPKTLGDLTFSVRSRLEFRDIEDNDANSIRYRLMLSLRHPISGRISALAWDEPFVNITRESWTGDRVLDRNRLFMGVRIDRDNHRFELGYLNQYVPRTNYNVMEHILVGYIFF